MSRTGRARRFDEYYRCYPIAMLAGPERESANHGGKVFLPASALDKLTTLHITYPMLFELINGAASKKSHSGVLEFIAEEGRCYLPFWVCTHSYKPCVSPARQAFTDRFTTAHANPLPRPRRSPPSEIHRPPTRKLHQTPTPIARLSRHIRPKSGPRKRLSQLLLPDSWRHLHL